MTSQQVDAVRLRDDSWGEPADREVLQRIAADVASRAGFAVCAIEVLRHDGMLEFVAVHGSPEGSARLLGQASPPDVMVPVLSCGAECGAFTFVAVEWVTKEAWAQMRVYSHVPDLPPSALEDAWDAEDMLVATLRGRDGEVRGMLYLDEPLDGRRPTARRLLTLTDDLALTFTAVAGAVEREALAQRYRLGHAARELIRSADSRRGVAQLLEETRTRLREGFRATDLHVRVLAGEGAREEYTEVSAYATPELLTAVEAAARLAYAAGTVAVVERDEVWGARGLDPGQRALLTGLVVEHGLGAVVVVPVATGGQLLGLMAIVRTADQDRWVESESAAAVDVGEDLGRAVLDARAFQKEQRLNAELRGVDAYRTELIATIAHQMKNPIGAVLGHLEMLEDHHAVTPVLAGPLGAMARATERLERLAESLLTLSNVGRSQTASMRAPVDLVALVTDAEELVSVPAARAEVRVEVEPVSAPGSAVVVGTADDLAHVVTNLLSNAVKYSDPGASVRVRLDRVGEEVVLTVADEGLGISEADQEHLFTEFFRSTDARALGRPGTGLGLTIVRRVVDGHGGRIEVDSTVGVGTTFRVVLPAA
ncbi:sensor histidine kinase [Nocardioides campestrisoli]|uniref:sensor histidine kinase n=1 Tax=Nocardioides campestrisoli TaxID=2736757 RepID=UPI0015E799CD|nr:HAMP domain-containing sensor histidine kinase [Nocardioides campestrisoli]